MISKEEYELLQFRGKREKYHSLHVKKASVTNDPTRMTMAINQVDEEVVPRDVIINHAKEFFSKFSVEFNDMEKNDFIFLLDGIKLNNKKYLEIQEKYKLNNINHLIWMKFTTKGHLGVVAASDDINFSLKNSSGTIIKKLGLEWDESFVLLFPLAGISDGMRKDLECGLGNYLISQKVPILDYYSHRFQ